MPVFYSKMEAHVNGLTLMSRFVVLLKTVSKYVDIQNHLSHLLGIPYPTIMATEWALVSKPKMFRTLGVLQKFHATYLAKSDLVLSGQAWDQEQNVIASFEAIFKH